MLTTIVVEVWKHWDVNDRLALSSSTSKPNHTCSCHSKGSALQSISYPDGS